MGPDPAVAAVRLAVRRALADLPPGDLVLAACSGGADSLALAAAVAFEAPRLGLRAGGVTVDHGLQPGSAAQARAVTQALGAMALDPVLSVTAAVAARRSQSGPPGRLGHPDGEDPGPAGRPGGERAAGHRAEAGRAGYPGPEGAARAGRYQALDAAAGQAGAVAILLGHTRDDQAEGVLLALARGSGTRSLAGMAPRHGRYLRPLLGLSRAQTRAACTALGLRPWDDPHNSNPDYARARVRHQLMPALEAGLGPGIAQALARSARALRVDADFLDSLAETEAERMSAPDRALDAGLVAALARGDQDPGAQAGRDRGRVPARRAHPPARGRARRAGDPLARPALDRPARGRPRPARVWQADLHRRGRPAAGPPGWSDGGCRDWPARGGRGWTRLTWAPTSRRC